MYKPPLLNVSSIDTIGTTYDNNGNRLSATVDGVTTSAYYTPDDNLEVYGDNASKLDSKSSLE